MWKNMKMARPGRRDNANANTVIGRPQLVETTFNENELNGYPDIADIRDGGSFAASTFASSSVPPHSESRAVPAAAQARQSRQSRQSRGTSFAPSVSSEYSQQTPHLLAGWQPNSIAETDLQAPLPHATTMPEPSRPDTAQVSPPSSPLLTDDRESRPVSPVDPNFTRSNTSAKASHSHASQIPIARKAAPAMNKFAQAVAAMKAQSAPPSNEKTTTSTAGSVAAAKMRWDEYSGEPSLHGKPPQVIPGHDIYAKRNLSNNAAGMRRPSEQHKNPQTSARFTAQPKASAKGLTVETKPREAWKGASGRSTIVPVPTDSMTQQRTVQPARTSSLQNTRPLIAPTTTPSAPPTDPDSESIDDTIKPVVPLKVGKTTPPRSLASPMTAEPPRSALASPADTIMPLAGHPWQSSQGGPPPPSTPPAENPPRGHEHTKSTESGGSKGHRENTTSRFSWTTYATSTTGQQSPPPSPPPPLPADASTMVHDSYAGRTHPTTALYSSPPQTTSSPPLPRSQPPASRPYGSYASNSYTSNSHPLSTATTTTRTFSSTTRSPPRPSSPSSFSTQKALPLPPPRPSSVGQELTTTLQDELDQLKLQKWNLQRVVHELRKERGAHANPLLTDFRKLREAEARAKELEEEIMDVIRQEHDVGLRLHRAWKRRERDDGYVGRSALWIRRVTEVTEENDRIAIGKTPVDQE